MKERKEHADDEERERKREGRGVWEGERGAHKLKQEVYNV